MPYKKGRLCLSGSPTCEAEFLLMDNLSRESYTAFPTVPTLILGRGPDVAILNGLAEIIKDRDLGLVFRLVTGPARRRVGRWVGLERQNL